MTIVECLSIMLYAIILLMHFCVCPSSWKQKTLKNINAFIQYFKKLVAVLSSDDAEY